MVSLPDKDLLISKMCKESTWRPPIEPPKKRIGLLTDESESSTESSNEIYEDNVKHLSHKQEFQDWRQSKRSIKLAKKNLDLIRNRMPRTSFEDI